MWKIGLSQEGSAPDFLKHETDELGPNCPTWIQKLKSPSFAALSFGSDGSASQLMFAKKTLGLYKETGHLWRSSNQTRNYQIRITERFTL